MPDPPAPPPPPHNSAPRADFRADPTSGTAPLTVRFSNASTDADGDAITSSWDFGDGSTSTDRSPTHLFTSAGAFTVTLVVTDARGAVATRRRIHRDARRDRRGWPLLGPAAGEHHRASRRGRGARHPHPADRPRQRPARGLPRRSGEWHGAALRPLHESFVGSRRGHARVQ